MMLTADQNQRFKDALPAMMERQFPLDELSRWLREEVSAKDVYGLELWENEGFVCGSCVCEYDTCSNCEDLHSDCVDECDITCPKCTDHFDQCSKCHEPEDGDAPDS